MSARYDAVVVGGGPNGLAAAITMARAGRRVLLVEANQQVGGAVASAQLTLPGFIHDVGAAVFPMALASPLFSGLPLGRHGLRWVHPPIPLAHPLDGGRATAIYRSVRETAAGLGRDGAAYARLMLPLAQGCDALLPAMLGPLFPPPLAQIAAYRGPGGPGRFLRALPGLGLLGVAGLLPAAAVGRALFREAPAAALFAGMAGHSVLPLSAPFTASYGLAFLLTAHGAGWPFTAGGAGRLAAALEAHLRELGGQVATGRRVESLDELPPARATLLDLSPEQALRLAGERLPPGYRRSLGRYRRGPGVFKVDWALDGPIPWQNELCRRAGTLHLGGALEEIAAAEAAVGRGEHPERPLVLLAQPSCFDPGRAPAGKHTAWAYCHVPNGSTVDMTAAIEAQVERFAPGFGARIIARSTMHTAALERFDANLLGGDITGGAQDLRQILGRPALRLDPYSMPAEGLYLCSASTPPGGGVHGMSGYHAAMSALRSID
jgi:phytoene dehydrogenase-like protein